jgi:hypothetical protein
VFGRPTTVAGSLESREDFVYKGATLESVMDFSNRIRSKFSSAHFLMGCDDPSATLLAEHELVIAIRSLTPSSELDMSRVSGNQHAPNDRDPRQPVEMRRYMKNNDIDVFLFCKVVNKSGEKRPANEFKDLWVTKTYLRCETSFPTNCKRVSVVERVQRIIRPIDVAVETIWNKNNELLDKIEQVDGSAATERVDVGPLSMNLNGILFVRCLFISFITLMKVFWMRP